MRIKTLVIAPYPAMTHLIEDCRQEEQQLDLYMRVANLQEAVPVAKEAEDQGFDVIISRGGTSKLIEDEVNIPVIDIHVSGYDMLRVLTLANDFPGKKAIVGFSNITLGAKAITDLLEIGIDVFTVESASEVDGLVEKLKQEGYELIMGDVITMDAATKHNLEGILIQSGREAIFEAFQKAKSIYRLHQRQQQEISLLRSLLEEASLNMIVLSGDGSVIYQHWTDFNECPLPINKLKEYIKEKNNIRTDVNILNINEQQIVKQSVKKKVIEAQEYYLFQFSETINPDANLQGISVETISQQPMIISNSQVMKRCVQLIDHNLNNEQWLLLGAEGAGKKLISQYIHYRKNNGQGLYASVAAENLLSLQHKLDPDVRTLYINEVEALTAKEMKKLTTTIKHLRTETLTIILALTKEEEIPHSLIYDNDLVRVQIPSLKDRKDDIRPLTTYFIAAFHGQIGTSVIKMKEDALQLLEDYSWPGNVAQLRSILHSAVLEEKGYVLGKKLLQQHIEEQKEEQVTVGKEFLTGTLADIEKRIIEHIMEEENHNQTKVAERLGMNRSTLWRKLKQ
ncbi:sigma-54-dependent transcriptional regulator [Metabacillus schmidteae]|uniref:sigma-54-dependent transcriptional regulator n=1 Tax=Metabacillus schmidteae TaxID=2730405 RepID=UPI001588E10B|nr:sigma-54-dependent transcriptional regulator [Metabacillus schmidteae]